MVKENMPELLLKENYKCDKKLKKNKNNCFILYILIYFKLSII